MYPLVDEHMLNAVEEDLIDSSLRYFEDLECLEHGVTTVEQAGKIKEVWRNDLFIIPVSLTKRGCYQLLYGNH